MRADHVCFVNPAICHCLRTGPENLHDRHNHAGSEDNVGDGLIEDRGSARRGDCPCHVKLVTARIGDDRGGFRRAIRAGPNPAPTLICIRVRGASVLSNLDAIGRGTDLHHGPGGKGTACQRIEPAALRASTAVEIQRIASCDVIHVHQGIGSLHLPQTPVRHDIHQPQRGRRFERMAGVHGSRVILHHVEKTCTLSKTNAPQTESETCRSVLKLSLCQRALAAPTACGGITNISPPGGGGSTVDSSDSCSAPVKLGTGSSFTVSIKAPPSVGLKRSIHLNVPLSPFGPT